MKPLRNGALPIPQNRLPRLGRHWLAKVETYVIFENFAFFGRRTKTNFKNRGELVRF